MKKELPAVPLYDLIPSQETMYIMIKYCIHKQVVQIPTSITVDKELDFELLKKAFNKEIERNDSLRLRFTKQDKKIKQYFLDNYSMYDIPVKLFMTEEEQEAYLCADAQKPIRFLKDETFRIIFFRTAGKGTGIYLNVSHLAMDATSVIVFYLDLMAVYKAMANGEELPEPLYNYEDFVKKDLKNISNKEKMAKDKAFFGEYFQKGGYPFYAGMHGPDLLEKERKKKKDPTLRVPNAYVPFPDKADIIKRHIGSEDAKEIWDFCLKTKTAPENLIQLGMRTHASKINYRSPDVFFTSLCSRRVSYKEKMMGGCLAQPLQVRTLIPEEATFTEALGEMFKVKTDLYRHMNFPYLWALQYSRELFDLSFTQGPACMMFSWIPLPLDRTLDININFKGYSLGRYIMPLYVISMPNMDDKGIDIYYMYRTNLISPENIHALHDNTVKVMLEGIRSPETTIGAILDEIPGIE